MYNSKERDVDVPVLSSIFQSNEQQVVRGIKERQVMWYPLEECGKHFRSDANENQIKRLSKEQQATVVKHCEKSLRHFGYLQTPRPFDMKNCIS